MQPSSSLRGTFAPDDVNPMHPHTPPPHRGPCRLARVDRFRAGYQFGKRTFAPSRLPGFLGRTFGFALLLTESIGAKNGFA
jgi:hypothetical protein